MQPQSVMWPVALCTVLILGLLQWDLYRKSNQQAGKTNAARQVIENLLLTYDCGLGTTHKASSWWQKMGAETSPEEISDLVEALHKESLMSDRLWSDVALVYDHFAKTTADPVWNKRADAALAQVHDKSGEEDFFVLVEAAIQSRALTQETTQRLSEVCRKWPVDWWVVQLARANGMDSQVSRSGLAARGIRAVWQVRVRLVIEWMMIVMGVVLPWPLWRMLRRSKSAQTPRKGDSLHHLRRLWSPAPTLLCFGLAGLFALGLQVLGQFSAPYLFEGVARHEAARWWLWIGYWMLYSVTGILAWPAAMKWCMAPELGSIRRVFDLRRLDFGEGRWWFMGIASSTMIFTSLAGLGLLAKWTGFSTGESDQLSRTFSTLQGASLPFGFLWGVCVAPWSEELLFRGFLFTGMKNKFGPLCGAIVSSILFSASHFYGWFGAGAVFLYGLFFCFVYQRTQRLAANMIIHGCINAPMVILKWLEWSA